MTTPLFFRQNMNIYTQKEDVKRAVKQLQREGFYLHETEGYLYVHKTRKNKFGVGMFDIENMREIGRIIDISFKLKAVSIEKREKGDLLE